MPASTRLRSFDSGETLREIASLRVVLPVKRPRARRPLVEELAHVGDQILDHRQVAQAARFRPCCHRPPCRHMGAAGPARHAVDRHRAGTADTDAAGKTIGQRRIAFALHVSDHIEHGLAFLPRHFEFLEAAAFSVPRQILTCKFSIRSFLMCRCRLRRRHRRRCRRWIITLTQAGLPLAIARCSAACSSAARVTSSP